MKKPVPGRNSSGEINEGSSLARIEKTIRDRSEKTGIGFSAEIHSKEGSKSIDQLLREVEPADLVKYGLIPELIGRLPVVALVPFRTHRRSPSPARGLG